MCASYNHANVSLAEWLGEHGALSRVLRTYEFRPEQLAMAHAVEEALATRTPLLVEAGTGTGKSLAYLVPAVRSGLRVVISTATKALGEQIIERDLPMLACMGLEPCGVVLVKGLSNYVCRRRLEEYRQAAIAGAIVPDPELDAVLRWVEETETGDRAELDTVSEASPLWREITSSSDTRLGARCSHYDRCFVTRMRLKAETARIVVTNHHLFCADLALRSTWSGAQALPDYDAVIFDEAHALEDVVTEFFGVRITRARVETLVWEALRVLERSGLFVDSGRAASVRRTVNCIQESAVRLFTSLPRPEGARDSVSTGRALLRREALDGPLGEAIHALDGALLQLGQQVSEFAAGNDTLLSLCRRTGSLREALARITQAGDDDYVAYCEADARGGGALGASPIEVGTILKEKLWAHHGAIVLTSATLSTAGERGFGFVRHRLGVPEHARELFLASPFDYRTQSALYVSRRLPDPREPGYFPAAVQEIRQLVDITEGGAFVLCTSVRQMRAFASELRTRWSYPTWVQGEAPKMTLLSRFRAAGNGVLVATSSFWEGVDVPGRALRLVIIDRLPFEAPTDAVVAARIRKLMEQGRQPFEEYQLPVAALALKQGFGRLIRTRRDVGIVAILDSRLVTRGYGKRLLAALPPATQCDSLDELRTFWDRVKG